jgi:regulator of sigma E protease
MGWIQPVFWVVILLGVMILIHELGHYWAALSVGVRVDTFSIGFGPRLFGFRRGDTDFRVSAILFGGYVRMLGELPSDEQVQDPRSLQAKSRWQRAIVVAAGPLMNILLAIGIVTGLYMHAFERQVDSTDPVITSVAPDSAAARAGLQAGDRIVQIGGDKNPNWQEVLTQEAFHPNHPIPVVVQRKNARLEFTVVPALDPKQGIGIAGWNGDPDVELDSIQKNSPAEAAGLRPGDLLISVNGKPASSAETVTEQVVSSQGKPLDLILMRKGQFERLSVTPSSSGESRLPWHIGVLLRPRGEIVQLSFFPALVESVKTNERYATILLEGLRSIVERRVSAGKMLSGPIGIAVMSSEAAHEGAVSYFGLMAMVSLNLAIFNLLPIPILDGGTLLMLMIEMLLQREVSLRVKETVFKLGFVFLMMVVVFVIYNDISRILTKS